MGKQFWYGVGAAIVTIWVAKNVPGVKDYTAPVLAKAGL